MILIKNKAVDSNTAIQIFYRYLSGQCFFLDKAKMDEKAQFTR